MGREIQLHLHTYNVDKMSDRICRILTLTPEHVSIIKVGDGLNDICLNTNITVLTRLYVNVLFLGSDVPKQNCSLSDRDVAACIRELCY